MNYFISALKKYAVFSGRASRAEYWYYTLFLIIISFFMGMLDAIMNAIGGVPFLSLIFGLGTFIPSIAVSIRRLHDVDKSGWNNLLPFIPLFGSLILFYFFIKKGDEHENKYGPIPTYSDDDSEYEVGVARTSASQVVSTPQAVPQPVIPAVQTGFPEPMAQPVGMPVPQQPAQQDQVVLQQPMPVMQPVPQTPPSPSQPVESITVPETTLQTETIQ